jgi:hypothetical protein
MAQDITKNPLYYWDAERQTPLDGTGEATMVWLKKHINDTWGYSTRDTVPVMTQSFAASDDQSFRYLMFDWSINFAQSFVITSRAYMDESYWMMHSFPINTHGVANSCYTTVGYENEPGYRDTWADWAGPNAATSVWDNQYSWSVQQPIVAGWVDTRAEWDAETRLWRNRLWNSDNPEPETWSVVLETPVPVIPGDRKAAYSFGTRTLTTANVELAWIKVEVLP